MVHGHVQPGVANHVVGVREASAVSELGPHDHRGQRADPVMGGNQRFARRLAPTEAFDVGPAVSVAQGGADGEDE